VINDRTALARPEDVQLQRADIAASRFLVRYQEPTRTGYALSLKQWFQFCGEIGVGPLDVDRAHIELWMRHLERKGLMASTINGKLNAVVGFYKLAKIDRVIVDDPSQHLRRPSVPNVSRRQGLTRAEALHVLDIAKASSPLDHALCCVLLYTGGRIGEVCRLDCEDLGREHGQATIYMSREKGNRSAPVPLPPRATWALDFYLGTRSSGPLFHKPRREERLDPNSARCIVRRITKKAGIAKTITPHSFRHTHITLALNAGVNTRSVVNSMGYADARQIARYDRDRDSVVRHSAHWVSASVEGA
jgi:site-specific recombinase XerD